MIDKCLTVFNVLLFRCIVLNKQAIMDHRMERAESMFTGTSRSKVIADIEFQPGTVIKVPKTVFQPN